jgi:hypothetical protein
MTRTLAVLIGAVAGLGLAGLAAAVAIPTLPAGWHSPPLLWGATALLVGGGVGAALKWSAPRKT